MEQLDAVLRDQTPRIGHWIDTSNLDVEQTVASLRTHLDAAAIP